MSTNPSIINAVCVCVRVLVCVCVRVSSLVCVCVCVCVCVVMCVYVDCVCMYTCIAFLVLFVGIFCMSGASARLTQALKRSSRNSRRSFHPVPQCMSTSQSSRTTYHTGFPSQGFVAPLVTTATDKQRKRVYLNARHGLLARGRWEVGASFGLFRLKLEPRVTKALSPAVPPRVLG